MMKKLIKKFLELIGRGKNVEKKYEELCIIPSPHFNSKLNRYNTELQDLRNATYPTEVHESIFLQLKTVFHLLESLGSVRIEGNNTTMTEAVDSVIDSSLKDENKVKLSESRKELANVFRALDFVETTIEKGTHLTVAHLRELHKIVVEGLTPAPDGEGDRTPGVFRRSNVKILKSKHVPPHFVQIPPLIDQFFAFTSEYEEDSVRHLLLTAMSHHNLAWIHPFSNGNGRVVRMFMYALLLSQGFSLRGLLNPTAVFCNDRDEYYSMLAKGDLLTEDGRIEWCEYVLGNLDKEMKKIVKLLDRKFLFEKILFPALNLAFERDFITNDEKTVLKVTIEEGVLRNADIVSALGIKDYKASLLIKNLRAKKMLVQSKNYKQKYEINFVDNNLLKVIILQLKKYDFIPSTLED